MKKLLWLFVWLGLGLMVSLGARAAEHFEGLLPAARDDLAAVAQLARQPDRHVLLYFGDHAN